MIDSDPSRNFACRGLTSSLIETSVSVFASAVLVELRELDRGAMREDTQQHVCRGWIGLFIGPEPAQDPNAAPCRSHQRHFDRRLADRGLDGVRR